MSTEYALIFIALLLALAWFFPARGPAAGTISLPTVEPLLLTIFPSFPPPLGADSNQAPGDKDKFHLQP